jgi:cytochrome c553
MHCNNTTPAPLARHALASVASLAMAGLLALATPPAQADDAAAGRTKANACAACHGVDGLSVNPSAPHLAGQPAMYVAEQLKLYRSGKRPNEIMAVIAKPLSDRDISDLAAWYASITLEAKLP